MAKMFQIGFVVWADLDRRDSETHRKNFWTYVVLSVLELGLILYFFIDYFYEVKTDQLENTADISFEK